MSDTKTPEMGDKVFGDTYGHYFIWDITPSGYVLYPQTFGPYDRSATFDITKSKLVPFDAFREPYWKLENKLVENFEKPLNKQVGGTHYTDLAIQPWEVITRNKMGFFDGNALKYIMRFRDKNGVEDLKKAIHYLEELIRQEESAQG